MLHFVLGTSGSGKSVYMLDQMKQFLEQTDKKVLLLVPEQFSFETERSIYRSFPKTDLRRIEVLSFMRLANSVFRQFGGLAGRYADASDKVVLMDLALEQVQDGLEVYRKTSGISLNTCMLDAVTEFKTWGITPQQLADAAQQLEEGAFQDKLRELALIYAVYDGLLSRTYLDQLDDIARAGELLKTHSYFSDTMVFIDAFDGFTANETEVIKAMLRQSPGVTVSLCMPSPAVSSRTGLFATVKATFNKLIRFAGECGVSVSKPVVLEPGKRFISGEMAHLEQQILREKLTPYPSPEGNVRIFSAANAEEEVEFVLATVKKLVQEEGYRYRDIVITARDLLHYQDILVNGFAHYDIPYFMDALTPVAEKPLIRFIGNLLRAADRCDVQDILNMLKCDVLPYSLEEVSVFENYLYTWNLKGADLKQELIAHPRGFEEHFTDQDRETLALVNRIREECVGIAAFLQEECADGDGKKISAAVYTVLEKHQIRGCVSELAEELIRCKQDKLAKECVQVWEIAMEILDSLAQSLSGRAVSLKRYLELYTLVSANYRVGEIPQRLDSVTVGSSERIRTAEPKAVFLLGMNDGVFPYVPSQAGVLTEAEKEQLEQISFHLSRGLEEMILQERFLAYKAMSAASQRLYLSYPRCSADGKPLAASFLIDQTERLFGSSCRTADEDYSALYYCRTEQTAFSRLAKSFRQDDELRGTLEGYLKRHGFGERIDKLYQMLHNDGFRLKNQSLAVELFGKRMKISASRFERYQQCRFLYFCQDGLKIRPRERAQLGAMESGTLIHAVIYGLLTGDKPLSERTDEEIKAQIKYQMDDYIETKLGGSAGKTERFLYLYRRLERMLFRIAVHLREEMEQSQFQPSDFEMPIGDNGPVGALEVLAPDGTTVSVEGRIDRVDIYEKNGVKYVRVIDYKTGEKKFELSDVYYGINMQMLLYLFSIWNTKSGKYQNSLPAGILYMPAKQLEAEYARHDKESEIEQKARKKYCMSGLVLEDEDVIEAMEQEVKGIFIPVKKLAKEKKEERGGEQVTVKYDAYSRLASLGELGKLKRYAEKLIGDMALELHRGNIDAVPLSGERTPCGYCPYQTVCGRQEDGACVEMQKFDSKQVFFERIEEVLADE